MTKLPPLPDLFRQLSEQLWDEGRLRESDYLSALTRAAHSLDMVERVSSNPAAAALATALGFEENEVSCRSCGGTIGVDDGYCKDCYEQERTEAP